MNLQELSEQVIKKANIIDLIGEVVELKQQKGGHWGLCPFHNDNHASMSVIDRDDKKMFNCFSCGAKGNVINFFSRYYGISYGAATIKLAIKLGIPVNENLLSENAKNDHLYKIMEEASNFYQFYLLNSTESKDALKYLEDRGITKDIIEEFRIGLAPDASDDLYITLKNQNINELDQIELGLVNNNQQGKPYDLFRKRIMFPIINQYNKVVGFSGRIYLPNQVNESKYINSKETKIFHKGSILYNFGNAAKDARTSNVMYIFEGFMDVIAAYKAGIYNSVAAMGTAFTDEHVKKILNVTKNIVLCFDGDDAGINALRKTVNLFSNFGIIPNAVILPNNMDPDEYLNKFGKDALVNFLKANNKNALEVLYDFAKSSLNLNDVLSIEKYKTNIFNTINGIGQESVIDYYLKKISADLNVNIDGIHLDFNNFKSQNRNFVSINASNIVNKPVYDQKKEQEVVIKKKSLIKPKHIAALKGIIAEILDSHHRFSVLKERLGDQINYIAPELANLTGIIEEIEQYYSEKNDLNLFRNAVPKNVSLFKEGSVQYNIISEIKNSIIYKNKNEEGFKENIDCIEKLLQDLQDEAIEEALMLNKQSEKNIKDFSNRKRRTTTIVKKNKKG